jgi:hypothetical protein
MERSKVVQPEVANFR